MSDERQKVSAYWGDHDFTETLARIHWMGSPVVRDYLNQLASGSPEEDWLGWAWDRYVLGGEGFRRRGAPRRVLVLGCGTGWLERSLARRPGVASIDACDVAEGAVEEARETARREGLDDVLRYHVVDLNREPPPGGPYDVAVAHSVLHHVENLEYAYPALAGSLVPGGLLVVNEYAGPHRFQFSDAQMAVINDVLARLPERYRASAVMAGAVYPHKERPTVEQMIATDPSESVRSDELLAFTRHHFEVVEERPYGGTVLQHLLYDVVQNFDPRSLDDARLLGLVCLLEEALIREGVLPSDYVLLVARRPEVLASPDLAEAGSSGGGGRQPPPPAAGGSAHRGEDRPVANRPSAGAPDAGGGTGRGREVEPVRGGLRLAPESQPVPVALPVRVRTARERGETPPAEARRTIHSRPRRDVRHGLDLPPLRRHLHRLATGDPACDWMTWVFHQLVPEVHRDRPPGAALVVEEPPAWLEPTVAGLPGVRRVDVLRPVGGAPQEGAGAAVPLHFRFRGGTARGASAGTEGGPPPVEPAPGSAGPPGPGTTGGESGPGDDPVAGGDAPVAPGDLELPGGAYDLVFSHGWLGRCPDRPALAARLVASLAPGGLWIGDEWLGPPDGRTSRRTLRYARELGELLQPYGAPPLDWKERLRRRLVEVEHEVLRRRFGPPAPDLAELLGPGCEVLVHRPTGGALLQRVLATAAGVVAAADGDGPGADAAAAFVALAAYLEERLTEAGAVESEFACFVARRRP